MPSTEELVKQARLGEASAYAELVRRYERAAILTANSVLGDFHLSQDAAQEAFVVAYRMLTRLRDAASFGPWLLKITRRQALQLQRRQNAEPSAAECVDPAATKTPDRTEPYASFV